MTDHSGKTLLLAENFPPMTGGASRRFWEIARRWPDDRLVVASTWVPGIDRREQVDVVRLSRRATEREFSGPTRAWPFGPALRELRALVRERGVERILCGRTLPEGWLARTIHALDGVPYDCFVHGEEVNTSIVAGNEGFLLSRRHRIMSRIVYQRAGRLIASSSNTARIMQEQWAMDPERVCVVLPGVDTAFFRPEEGGQLPDRLAGWAGRRVVLSASRLQKRKGHDALLRAVGLVRDRVPGILLEIVGSGEEAERLQALVDELGLRAHVSFSGEVSDTELRSFYQHCEVFVLANRQVGTDLEGFGMVLLEAQACGTPVIAGNSGGTSEALIDGRTGFVVDCRSVDELADRIVEILSDGARRKAMGSAARALMVESFDWDVVLAGAPWSFELPRKQ